MTLFVHNGTKYSLNIDGLQLDHSYTNRCSHFAAHEFRLLAGQRHSYVTSKSRSRLRRLRVDARDA